MYKGRETVTAAMLVLLSAFVALAEDEPQMPNVLSGSECFVVTVKGMQGFIDAEGKLVIAPSFQTAYAFSDGLAVVQVDGMWGYIDTKGNMVIKPQFAAAGFFSEGLASFRNEPTAPWGYISKMGDVVIKPQFDTAEKFRNGVARVGLETLVSKIRGEFADVGLTLNYRFIDRTGKFVPEPGPTHFATGTPGELIPFEKNGRWGYVDSKGEVVIKPQFEHGFPFSDGLARARTKALYGYIDKSGKFVIPPRFTRHNDFSEGLAGVRLDKKSWGFIDPTGEVVIPPKFEWVHGGFRHGLAKVTLGGKIGYINKKGK